MKIKYRQGKNNKKKSSTPFAPSATLQWWATFCRYTVQFAIVKVFCGEQRRGEGRQRLWREEGAPGEGGGNGGHEERGKTRVGRRDGKKRENGKERRKKRGKDKTKKT